MFSRVFKLLFVVFVIVHTLLPYVRVSLITATSNFTSVFLHIILVVNTFLDINFASVEVDFRT